jgi:hypothetical protein
MVLNRSRDFCANFAQLLRNTATGFAPPKLCLGKMSDGKLPILHQRHRCVHHYRRQLAASCQRQKASYCGKFVAAFCRFLPLRFCPVFSTTISLGDGVYPQTGFPRRSLHRLLSPALNVWQLPGVDGSRSWLGRGRFAAGLAKRFAPWLACKFHQTDELSFAGAKVGKEKSRMV